LYSLRKNKSTPFWNQDKAISAKPIGNQTPLREGGGRLSWGQVVYLRLSRTDWLSGSGGTGETSLHYRAISGKMRRFPSGKEPLSAGIYPDGGPSFYPQKAADKKLFLSSRCSAASLQNVLNVMAIPREPNERP